MEDRMSANAQVFQIFFKFIFREVLNGSLISPDLCTFFYHVNFQNIIRQNWSIFKLINVTNYPLIDYSCLLNVGSSLVIKDILGYPSGATTIGCFIALLFYALGVGNDWNRFNRPETGTGMAFWNSSSSS